MSYILDALRKADAQRERDPARGIHAQPLATLPGLHKPKLKPWHWAALGGVVLAATLLAWQLFEPAQPQVVAVPIAAVPTAVAQVPAPVVLPPPIATPEAVIAPVIAPAPATRSERKSKPAPVVATAAAAAPPAESRILPVSEIPPDMPKLAISGGVYSDNPAQRMLIVNGQVIKEGVELAPGMLLEQIRAKSVVLRVRGLRYSVPY